MYIFHMFTIYIYIYYDASYIYMWFSCCFNPSPTQASPLAPKSKKKMVFSLDDTAQKNNPFHLLLTVVTCQFRRGGVESHIATESAPCISCGVFHGPRALASKKNRGSTDRWKHHDRRKKNSKILLMEEPLHQLMCRLSHYLQGLQ